MLLFAFLAGFGIGMVFGAVALIAFALAEGDCPTPREEQ